MGLEKQVTLVVGGTGDIGMAICRRVLDSGSSLVVAGINQENADQACEKLAAHGHDVMGCVMDVSSEESCKDAIAMVAERHGRLDGVVNCAGISYIAPVMLGKIEDCRRVLEINSLGAYIVSKAVLRIMIKQRYGRIVHIGSISSQVGAPYNAIYAASKAAVAGLVRSLALEIAATGITVNAVQPGYVKTKLFAQTQGARARIKGVSLETHENDLINDTPTRVLVSPEDVASLVNYLLSPESHSITGQCLNVDGGRTAN